MDIVLNDKSLEGQFTEDDFKAYMREEVLPCFDVLNKHQCTVYKDYNTYDRPITDRQKLADFLKIQGDPVVSSFKRCLVQLLRDDPYWRDAKATRDDVTYVCDIEEIPNGITEAYERDGILFSFQHDKYHQPYFNMMRNDEACKVRNADRLEFLKKHLSDTGIAVLWDSNSFYINGTGCKFEIRFRENNHNKAHFHITAGEESISLSIPDVDVLAGSLPADVKNKMISWACQNMDKIIELWNKYHPERKVYI